MFPFGNSDNNLEPLFRKPSFQLYDEIQNPISKHDDSPFFSNFPSPFFDEHELPLNQIFQTDEKTSEKQWSKKTEEQPRSPQPRARKRTGKKDRHSKIRTAQGIRDRRMRLSLQVARKFFDLQDMLGYDKASKTIEWLFNKSNKAIKDIITECEVMSENEENSNNEIKEDVQLSEHKQIKSPKRPRKTVFKPNTRDSREKARERARCRTEEKLMMGKQQIQEHEQFSKSSDDLEKLGLSSSSPFGFDDQENHAQDYTPLVYQPSDVGTIDNLLGNSSSSASNRPISCFIDPNNMGCFRNWDGLFSNEIANIQASIVAGNPNSIYSDTTPDFPLFRQ